MLVESWEFCGLSSAKKLIPDSASRPTSKIVIQPSLWNEIALARYCPQSQYVVFRLFVFYIKPIIYILHVHSQTLIHHHPYVPSVVNRSAVMDLHCSRSCATLMQSLNDIFVHSLMLSVYIVLGLPRPLLPFILPSISNRCTPSPLIICPKYWHFLFLIAFNNDLLVFILCKTSPSVLCSSPWYS